MYHGPRRSQVPLGGWGGFGTTRLFGIPGGGTSPNPAQSRAELGSLHLRSVSLPELLQIPEGNLPKGRRHGSGHQLQHPPAVPDCHPPMAATVTSQPSLGRIASTAGALWARHSDGESQPQKQLVGRGRGRAVPRRVAAGGQGAQGRWVLAVLFLQLHTPRSMSHRASAPELWVAA